MIKLYWWDGPSLFPSSHFLPALLRHQRSQLTPSLRVQLLHKPSRDWRTRTDFSHRFNTPPIDTSHEQLPVSTVGGRVSLTSFVFLLLVKEVTERSERIAQLEQEKSALIKQLFEARARSAQDTSTMDSTFIWEQLHSTQHHNITMFQLGSILTLV